MSAAYGAILMPSVERHPVPGDTGHAIWHGHNTITAVLLARQPLTQSPKCRLMSASSYHKTRRQTKQREWILCIFLLLYPLCHVVVITTKPLGLGITKSAPSPYKSVSAYSTTNCVLQEIGCQAQFSSSSNYSFLSTAAFLLLMNYS